MRAVSVAPVRGFCGGETGEGFPLSCETAMHVDRLFAIHEPHWHIEVRSEQRLLTEPNLQRLGRRGGFGENRRHLVDGRDGGAVRGKGEAYSRVVDSRLDAMCLALCAGSGWVVQ